MRWVGGDELDGWKMRSLDGRFIYLVECSSE